MAFNAKNLHYDKTEPSFLRKVKGEFGNLDGRHNVQLARPKKDRLKTGDDDEDEPVIVDEQGERIEKAEFERRVNGHDEEKVAGGADGRGKEDGEERAKEGERQKVTEIGTCAVLKKRKVVKVIGDEDEASNPAGKAPPQQSTINASKQRADKPVLGKKEAAAPKKKSKKIKLSFDEPE